MKLRAVEPGDARLMFRADNDEECRMYSDYVAPLSLAMLEEYASNYDADPFKTGQLRLIIEADVPVGILDIYDLSLRDSRAHVGIYILPEFRKKGYGRSALRLLFDYAAENLCIQRIVAKVPANNIASLRLFESVGFSQDAVLSKWKRIGRELTDIYILSKFLNLD